MKNMVKYREIFLKKMKFFLSYFMEFKEDGIILFKKYLDNCKIRNLSWLSIIMIRNNKSLFSTNNNY